MRTATISAPPAKAPRFRLPDGSRSVQSPWVWRGFLFMSIVAFGFALTFAAGRQFFYAVSWLVITIGWFSISMWLWRKNVLLDREWLAADLADRKKRRK